MAFLERKRFFYQHDLDSTSYKYGRLGDASGHAVRGKWGLKTTGSSTTIDRQPAAGDPFAPVTVGSMITFYAIPDTSYVRKVVTKASTAQIVVDTAVNLGTDGVAWQFMPFSSGTTANDGWHRVANDGQVSVFVDVITLAAVGGVGVQVETLIGNRPHIIVPEVVYAATGTYEISITSPCDLIRVGLRAVTDSAGTDSISVFLQQRLPRKS